MLDKCLKYLYFKRKAADAGCITDQSFEHLYPAVCYSRHFHRCLYKVCGSEEEMDFAHTVCKSCDAAKLLLTVTENRRRLSSVR